MPKLWMSSHGEQAEVLLADKLSTWLHVNISFVNCRIITPYSNKMMINNLNRSYSIIATYFFSYLL